MKPDGQHIVAFEQALSYVGRKEGLQQVQGQPGDGNKVERTFHYYFIYRSEETFINIIGLKSLSLLLAWRAFHYSFRSIEPSMIKLSIEREIPMYTCLGVWHRVNTTTMPTKIQEWFISLFPLWLLWVNRNAWNWFEFQIYVHLKNIFLCRNNINFRDKSRNYRWGIFKWLEQFSKSFCTYSVPHIFSPI